MKIFSFLGKAAYVITHIPSIIRSSSMSKRKNKGKIISDSDFETLVNGTINNANSYKNKEIKSKDKLVDDDVFEKINNLLNSDSENEKIDFDKVDILDYLSELLQDYNLTNKEQQSLYEKIQKITENENSKVEEELRDRLKDISEVDGIDKYNAILAVIESLGKRYNISFDEEEVFNTKNEDKVDEKNIENENLNSLLFDQYLRRTPLDSIKAEKIFEKMDKISELKKENELIEFIYDSQNIEPELRYRVIMEEMDRIIEGRNYSMEIDDVVNFEDLNKSEDKLPIEIIEETKENENLNNNETSNTSNIIYVFPNDSNNNENTTNKDIEVENNKLTKEDYFKEYQNNKITAKELVDVCNEIDEKNQKEYEEEHNRKCKKYYDLYQKRMEELLVLNDRVNNLKSEVAELGTGKIGSDNREIYIKRGNLLKEIKDLESTIDALSVRIIVLEEKGYGSEYQKSDREAYVNYWEEVLSNQEKETEEKEKHKKQSNCEMLELFSDEELNVIKEGGFEEDPNKIEAIIEFKKKTLKM